MGIRLAMSRFYIGQNLESGFNGEIKKKVLHCDLYRINTNVEDYPLTQLF